MNADQETPRLLESDAADRVLGAFFGVHNALGCGFLESVYQAALAIEFRERGLPFVRQPPLVAKYRGETVGEFRPDFLVDRRVIVEIKAISSLASAHGTQLVDDLKATGLRVGLLLNFGARPEFRRPVLSDSRSA